LRLFAQKRNAVPKSRKAVIMEKRTHYGVTFAVLATGALAYCLLQSLIIPAIPLLEHTLHVSASGAAWLLTGYLLSSAITTPILGRIGDMVGKQKMIVIVLIAVSAGTLISALATSFPIMLVGRVLQGAGGAIFPLAFGIIRDEFPAKKVAGGIGLMSAMLGVGLGAGIVLAGPVLQYLSYHWLFWIPLVLLLVATVTAFIFVPGSPVRTPGRINWTGAALMSSWLITGLIGVSYGPTWGWKSGSVLGLFGATAVLIGFWIRSEARSKSPTVDMKMMRIPAVWRTNLASLLFGFGMFALFVIVPQFVQTPSRVGYGFTASVTQSGLDLSPYAVAMLIVAPLTGRISRAIGSKPVLIAGTLFGASCYGLLAFAHSQPWNIYLAAGLLGIAVALSFASSSNLIIEAVPVGQTGVATGMNTNIRNIGVTLGTGVATSLVVSGVAVGGFPREHGYVLAFAVCGAGFMVAALAALMIPDLHQPSVVVEESRPGLTAESEVM
jgi:MFS family permease